MKALIRNEGETITEGMGIPCIDWDTGHPLTNPKWFGGPYKLINDYVVIDGKKYSKEELRSLLE